jgi:tRNA(fMet)-specific endonuclease VapC
MVEKKIVLDTNTVIDLLKGTPKVVSELEKFDVFYLTTTICGELLFGAKNSGKKAENESKYRKFIEKCLILNIDFEISDEYSNIRLNLKKKGKPIPENDIWIAATCIVNNLALISRDTDFENVEGLIFHKLIY